MARARVFGDKDVRPTRDERSGKGWHSTYPVTAIGHYCFPPRAYPTGVGPGTEWACARCLTKWMSHGAQVVGDYPVDMNRLDAVMGPDYWTLVSNGSLQDAADYVDGQESLYDFRSSADLAYPVLKRLLNAAYPFVETGDLP